MRFNCAWNIIGLKISLLSGLLLFMVIPGLPQNENIIDANNPIYNIYIRPGKGGISEEEQALKKSKSGDVFNFMNLRKTIGALNAMITATGEPYWINQQVRIINNLLQTAQTSSVIPHNLLFRDEFKSWISLNPNKNYHQEVPLSECYSFLYITQFLFLVRHTAWLEKNENNLQWWNHTLAFIERNIWTKWYDRSFATYKNHYRYFLRTTTDMGSNWAGLALYLNALTADTTIKSQTALLTQQYDTLLKRNLKVRQGAYIWNSTYNNVEGSFAGASSKSTIQDVSHGNQVVAYVVAAYEAGNKNWLISDIYKFANTVKFFMYNREHNLFRDNVDGSSDEKRPGWGNFVSDGWVKLAGYDDEVKAIFKQFGKTKKLQKYNQEFQFKANLYKIDQQHE